MPLKNCLCPKIAKKKESDQNFDIFGNGKLKRIFVWAHGFTKQPIKAKAIYLFFYLFCKKHHKNMKKNIVVVE